MTPWIFGGRITTAARCRLFCLPHSGSGASQFAPWQRLLPAALDLCPIQLPGRENRFRDTPFYRIDRIVDSLTPALETFLDRPYILYGYSVGALIAFELARQLRRKKFAPPVALFALARSAPHVLQTNPPLRHLPDNEFLAEVGHRYGGMAPAILQNRELMELILPALRADITALETYVCREEEPLDCSIHAYGGTSDASVTQEDLGAWRLHTKSSFDLELLNGDHFFVRNHQQAILESISALIPGSST